jgi:hypothetical protein
VSALLVHFAKLKAFLRDAPPHEVDNAFSFVAATLALLTSPLRKAKPSTLAGRTVAHFTDTETVRCSHRWTDQTVGVLYGLEVEDL